MKTQIDNTFQFRAAFEKDYGVSLSENETEKALERLTNFFDLLDRFDRQDREKLMQMKGLKNESNSL